MPKRYAQPEMFEWSFLVSIEDIDARPKIYNFAASPQQCADLARRMGVVSVERADASVTVQKVGGGIIHAMGHARADLTQSCVATLHPVHQHLEEEFEGWFGDHSRAVSFARARSEREAKKGHVEVEIQEESVDPEPIVNGKVDLGELATQYLCLALDPYPRAEGVEVTLKSSPRNEAGVEIRKNPFEALKDWKEKR